MTHYTSLLLRKVQSFSGYRIDECRMGGYNLTAVADSPRRRGWTWCYKTSRESDY